MMKVISVNVGRPREILHEGRVIRTGIFKEPVAGRVRVTALNPAGDEQVELTVHGGPSKAVYVYPSEHYEFWRKELPQTKLPWGMFGEKLTSEGLPENDVNGGARISRSGGGARCARTTAPTELRGIPFRRSKRAAAPTAGVRTVLPESRTNTS